MPAKTTCKNGHDLTNPENVRMHKNGYPRCKVCDREYNDKREKKSLRVLEPQVEKPERLQLAKLRRLSASHHLPSNADVVRLYFVLHPDPRFRAVYYSTKASDGHPAYQYYLSLDEVMTFLKGEMDPEQFKTYILKQVNAQRAWVMNKGKKRKEVNSLPNH